MENVISAVLLVVGAYGCLHLIARWMHKTNARIEALERVTRINPTTNLP